VDGEFWVFLFVSASLAHGDVRMFGGGYLEPLGGSALSWLGM